MHHSEARLAVIVPAYNEEMSIEATLGALYDQTYIQTAEHIIIDNGSTDGTRAAIERFTKSHDDFPLRVIEESQKGTGAAADTGARIAIEHGASVVARTDADTLPLPNWTSTILSHFSRQANLQLVGGRTMALHNADYRRGDDLLMPLSVKGARVALAIRHFDANYLRVATGGNLATRNQAYTAVGGFPRSSIHELDEDVAYSLKVARAFGHNAVAIDNNLVVATSMRRIRNQGWVGTAMHHLAPERRRHNHTVIDIR